MPRRPAILRYTDLLESFPHPTLIVKQDGEIWLANGAAARALRYEPSRLAGLQLGELVRPERREELAGSRLRSTRADVASEPHALEVAMLRGDGAELASRLTFAPLAGAEHGCLVCTIQDWTEPNRLRAELEARSEELSCLADEMQTFSYRASHDLAAPLRTIESFAKLLAGHHADKTDERSREFIDFIVDGTTEMRQLLDGLLAYSRVGSRGAPLEPTPSDEALDRTLAVLRPQLEDAKAVVVREPLPTVVADRAQLEQLFATLVSNALKFAGGSPPRLHVSAQTSGPQVVFRFRDEGIGIEPKYFSQIFGIFRRLHTRREYPGAGIGLAIAERIVQRHHGRIWVESEPGKGSTFFVGLPGRDSSPAGCGWSESAAEAAPSRSESPSSG